RFLHDPTNRWNRIGGCRPHRWTHNRRCRSRYTRRRNGSRDPTEGDPLSQLLGWTTGFKPRGSRCHPRWQLDARGNGLLQLPREILPPLIGTEYEIADALRCSDKVLSDVRGFQSSRLGRLLEDESSSRSSIAR